MSPILAALVLGLTTAPTAHAGIGLPGRAVPVPGLDLPCQDPRYPALAGAWIVACGPDGRVDRALSLASGREQRLPRSFAAPALAPGLLVGVGTEAGAVTLAEDGPTLLELPLVRGTPTAPPSSDGARVAMVEAAHVSAWPLGERSRSLRPAHPAGWYPPALAGARLAWVEDAGPDGEDVWVLDEGELRPTPRVLAGGPGAQRHVVGSGPFLAWVEAGALVILDTRDDHTRRLPVDTGFSAPPTLWEGVACWEERPADPPGEGADGVDVRCSDGLEAAGPGHQRWPSRHGPWLLYRQDDGLWLYTAAPPGEAPDASP